MSLLAAIGEKFRAEDRDALASRAADARVGDAVRTGGPQRPGQMLSRGIIFVVVDERIGCLPAPDIVKLAVEIDEVDAPVELLGGFPGPAHETRGTIDRLGNRRLEIVSSIEDALSAIFSCKYLFYWNFSEAIFQPHIRPRLSS
jgi:hypothetical protein